MSDKEPRIFLQSDVERQRAELSRLRGQQAAEIVMCGLASRMIAACGPTNETAMHTPLNEGSELTIERYRLTTLEDVFFDMVFQDMELADSRNGGRDQEDLILSRHIVKAVPLPSFGLAITRYDSPTNVNRQVGCRYTIGCGILDGWPLPMDGMTREDVTFMEWQLGKIDQLRVGKELTILDPETLREVNPLIIDRNS